MNVAFTIPIWVFGLVGTLAGIVIIAFAVVGVIFMRGFGGGLRY